MVTSIQDEACQICKSKLTRLLMPVEATSRLMPYVPTESIVNHDRTCSLEAAGVRESSGSEIDLVLIEGAPADCTAFWMGYRSSLFGGRGHGVQEWQPG